MKTQIRRSRLVSVLLLGLLTLLTACQPIQPQPLSASQTTAMAAAATTTTEANKALVERLYEEAFNQKNLEFFAEAFSPDAVAHDLDRGVKEDNNPALLLAGFPDLQVTIEQIVVEGEMVTTLVTFRGTHQGEFLKVAPTGKPMTFSLIDMFRFQDGKIVELWHYVPNEDILEQIAPQGK